MKKTLTPAAQVAKLIRVELNRLGIKCRVTSSNYSMGNSVHVHVTDQSPAIMEQLKHSFSKYEYGHFDGMTDCYEYSNRRDDVPQTKYLFIENECSDEMKQRIWEYLRSSYPGNFSAMPGEYNLASNIYDGGFEERISVIVHQYFAGAYQYESFWSTEIAA